MIGIDTNILLRLWLSAERRPEPAATAASPHVNPQR